MREADEALRAIELVVFTIVAIVAIIRWRRSEGPAAAWLAATFTLLAAVVVVGRFLPDGSDGGAAGLARSALVAALVLFPFCLYRFAATFRTPSKPVELLALVLTGAAVAGSFLVGPLGGEDEPASTREQLFIVVVLVEWVTLSSLVTWWLWRAGHGQPTVARRRMRLLSLGAAGMALALVLAGSFRSSEGVGLAQVLVGVLAVASAPLFLLGFAPPGLLLASWRRPEELELREAEAGLMAAVSPSEVADVILPRVARVMGASHVELTDGAGRTLGVHATPSHRAGRQVATSSLAIPVGDGQLLVRANPYVPYFGSEEATLLASLGRMADVALRRSELSLREREVASRQEHANATMRDFIAAASHDLRTPITVIKGFARLTRSQWATMPEESKVENLSTIERQSELLSRLVDDLLTVSRIDADALAPDPEVIVLGDHVARTLGDLRFDDVEVDVPAALEVFVDADHLTRIIRNYVENARSYGEPPISVTAAEDGEERVVIRVVDRGAGVPPAFVDQLFGRFARADKAKSRNNNGTGLGLSITRGLARAAGGDAWYEPSFPSGSCFVVTLPTARSTL